MIKSIKAKVVIIITTFLIITVMAGGFLYYHLLEKEVLIDLNKKCENTLNRLSISLSYFLWNLDREGIYDVLKAEVSDKNIYAILVFDSSGELFAGVYQEKGGTILKVSSSRFPMWKNSIISNRDINFHSRYGIEKLGSVIVYLNPEPTIKELRGYFIENFINFFLIVILADIIILIILHNYIFKKLNKLMHFLKAVANRDFSRKIPKLGDDELGFLAKQYNFMISRLKEYEDELFYRIKRWEITLRSIGDAVIITDSSGKITLMNDVACKLTGYREKDAIGKDLKEVFVIVNEITKKPVKSPVEKVIKTGRVVGLANHTVLISKNGREIPIRDSAAPIKDHKGNILGVVLVFTDMSFEVDLIKKVEHSQMIQKGLMDVTNVIMAITDVEGNCIFWNRAAEVITGYTKKDVLGKDIGWKLMYPDKEYREKMLNRVYNVIEKGLSIDGDESKITTKFGEKKIISWYSVGLMDKNRDPKYCLHVGVDITDKKRMEKELIDKKTLEAISLFASGVAHDFNNIVTGIMGNIDLIKRLSSIDEIHDRLNIIEKSLKYASNMVSQLLTLAKDKDLKKEPIVVEELIQELIEVLGNEKIEYEIFMDNDLALIYGDRIQLSQALQNIIVNAIQASEGISNKIYISATNKTFKEPTLLHEKLIDPGDYIEITVKDYGKGIPKDIIPRIFEPFFTTKKKGHGLGLSFCYFIIKEHGGEILVESQLGKGTTFTLYLPAINKIELEDSLSQGELEAESKLPQRVLLVEDDEMIGEVTKELLHTMGIENIIICKNGKEAIDKYKEALENENRFEVVFCDLSLAGNLNGKLTFKEILEIDPHAIGIITSGDVSGILDYKMFGFKAMLKKPYTYDELKEVIFEVMNKYYKD